MAIHPTAVVHPSARLDPSVEVGAYAVVEGDVQVGAGTRIYPHAFVGRYTTIGAACEIHPFAVVGHVPQDLSYDGAVTYARIGDGTVIREGATVHRAAVAGAATVVGARCLLMATCHVGHDCVLGNEVKLANGALLAGHVVVADRAFVSGNCSVHQFVRIGELAMVGGGLRVNRDVPPFMMLGPRGVEGPNVVGLRRAGVDAAARQELRRCHRILYRSGLTWPEALARVADTVRTDPGRRLLAFLQEPSRRGFMGYRRRRGDPGDDGDPEAC